MEGRDLGIRQMLDGVPHDQIVRSDVVIPVVGSAELVNGLCSETKKTAAATVSEPLRARRDQTQARLDDVIMNVPEERKRLRREAVTTSRANMEPVEIAQRLFRSA